MNAMMMRRIVVRIAALVWLLPLVAWADTVVEYIHTDALGTPIAVTDASGNVIQTSEYAPYGELLNRAVTDGPGFTGHVQDAATGLTYMQQRYYDPSIGRFLSRDPVTANPNTGANFNAYWYANSNPYRFTDPDGRQSVGEMIDDNAMAAAASDKGAATYGWAFAAAAWKFLGAESVSQVADKGLSETSNGDKAGAALEVVAALPPVKILGEVAILGKEAATAERATQGTVFATTKEATRAAESMGFKRVNETVSGQAIYKRGNDYITRDATGHNGGAWKMADSINALGSKETRAGTYSADLKKRIGD